MEERLQKLISASGLTSRRGAEDWITWKFLIKVL